MLLYLCALVGLAGAQLFNASGEVDISAIPITFYGRQYDRLYVNMTDSTWAICFTGYVSEQPGVAQDCIIGPSLIGHRFGVRILENDPTIVSAIRYALPNITSDAVGYVSLTFMNNYTSDAGVLLINCGPEAAMSVQIPPGIFDILVDGVSVYSLNITSKQARMLDISGCRHSGGLHRRHSVLSSNPENCSRLICDNATVIRTIHCGPMERCLGNGICLLEEVCTVTGPAVIDVHGQVHSVQDRCAYSLLSFPSVPGFHVLANFQDRRRKDVSLLDSVTLSLEGPGVHFHLEQGARVRLDATALTLNGSTQLLHGVELSKDRAGVTAKVTLSGFTASVFFDGDTAQIYITGAARSELHGLCGNSSSSEHPRLRLFNYSASGCETQHSDAADSAINCSLATERCNLLNMAPFTACHQVTNPDPYVTACSSTLCRYPPADALNCRFLEAYARACSLQDSEILEDWRSTAGCSPPQAFCQDKVCAAHEFCGENSGHTGCFCRAIFSSPYRAAGSLGELMVCGHGAGSLTLLGCLLEERGIDYLSLRLNDQTCKGHIDALTHNVTFSFNSSNTCGTVVTVNNSRIVYKNTITTLNTFSDIIDRHNQVSIDFSCFYVNPDVRSMAFRGRHSSVVQQVVSGAWNYTLTMKAYTDAALTQLVDPSNPIQLDQKIWVELNTDGLDGGLVAVVTDSCWATSQASPSGSPRYDLIIGGCANLADETVVVQGNGLGTSNHFYFKMFQFSGGSADVYLHCRVNLCVTQSQSCTPMCGIPADLRRRRSTRYEDAASAFITMAWTN